MHKTRIRIVEWIVLLLFTISTAVALEPGKVLYPALDSHLHYLDFTQRTDGFAALVQAMDAAGVESAVVFGMPIVKQWSQSDAVRPSYYLETDSRSYYFSATDYILAEELLKQPQDVQRRFYPFISGINPLDQNAAEYIEILLNLYPGFWKGIGEIMSKHDDLTAFTYGEPPTANHPALMKVYLLAAKYHLPVLIHHNISSTYRQDAIYLPELENAVAGNPETIFIWAHAGISRRVVVQSLPQILDRVLATYTNLNVDLSWLVYEDYVAMDLKVWVELIERYPDRFLIGSDKVGHWDTYNAEITKYNPLLQELSVQTAKKIIQGNIQRLLRASEEK